MNTRKFIPLALIPVLAAEFGHEKSAVLPHVHEESQKPEGPNTYTLSVALSGGTTTLTRHDVCTLTSGERDKKL